MVPGEVWDSVVPVSGVEIVGSSDPSVVIEAVVVYAVLTV